MSYLTTEIRFLINDYASSGIISNQRAFDEIKKLYPDFSLVQLYLRYVEWKTLYTNVLALMTNDLKEIYDRIYDKLVSERAEYNLIYDNDKFSIYLLNPEYIELFKSLVGNDYVQGTNGSEERTIHSFTYTNHLDVLEIMVKYFDILNCKPGHVNILEYSIYTGNQSHYTHTVAPIIDGDNTLKQRYIDEIVKIDPEFTLQHVYSNIKKKYGKVMELDKDIMDTIIANYDNIKRCSYYGLTNNIVIGTSKRIDKWDIDEEDVISSEYHEYSLEGDYSKFLSIVGILESDVNNNYNRNQQELHYYSYSTPIINPY